MRLATRKPRKVPGKTFGCFVIHRKDLQPVN